MKKLSLLLAVFCIAIASSAQLKTYSANDSNLDGDVNISDVNSTISEICGTVSSSKVVSADSLAILLLSIDSRLAAIEKKLGISDSTVTPTPDPEPTPSDTHEYVEIGGLKWATMNLGATTVAGDPSTCYGDYYAWGETEPRYTSITISGANSVSFGGWSSSHSSGYTSDDYPTYKGTTLDADHDAATVNWGSDWRTPTSADFQALANACTGSTSSQCIPSLSSSSPTGGIYWLSSSQTYLSEYKGVAGILFVDKTDTSKRVFFPAAGSCRNTSFIGDGSYGYYWSSSLYTSNTNCAYGLIFLSSLVYPSNNDLRYDGFTVRPVSE